MSGEREQLKATRDEFVAQWGAMGSQWGINRTMAQIHALLMIALEPMSTDDVMAELLISRGNAHTNLKELVAWGLVRIVVKKGERREFFEAEKDGGERRLADFHDCHPRAEEARDRAGAGGAQSMCGNDPRDEVTGSRGLLQPNAAA
jgi:hypothetical protein